MRVLVWQWGRFGAGPRFAACLADALRDRPGVNVTLSLSRDAEIMGGANPPPCEMPVRTYTGLLSFLMRLATAPFMLPLLWYRLHCLSVDLAICAMPGPLDLLMTTALKLTGAKIVVVVHDADTHKGDGFPMQMALQRMLCHCADGLAALSTHVAERLKEQRLAGTGIRPLIRFEHPPFAFGARAPQAAAETHRGRHLLFFGRLLPYKGLDLLAVALTQQPRLIEVRVVGHGPESPALYALRAIPGVTVENRWVPEAEIGSLLDWADALILPYREASQSGVVAAALAAGRPVIATRVGGLREQLANAPQAVLCDPEPQSLARAIGLWLDSPISELPRAATSDAWHRAATTLMQSIQIAIPPAQRPSLGGATAHLARP